MCLLLRFIVSATILAGITLSSPVAFAQGGVDASRATSVASVGIGPFIDARGARVSSAVKSLAEAALVRLNARTYLKAKPISQALSPGEKAPTLRPVIAKAGVDGLLLAEVGDYQVHWSLIGPLGQVVISGTCETPGLGTEQELALTADRLVDAVAASVPYRSFITKEIGPDVYEIAMGSSSGVVKGQRLRVFEFSGPDFKSSRSETGVVEVVSVNPDSAEVEAVSGKKLGVFQKIAFEERARGMSLQDPAPTKGHFLLGGGLLTISSDSPSAAYDNKVYRLSSTPALVLGVGFGKTEITASFAQAQSTTEDLVFSEVLLDRQLMGSASGLWGWKLVGGLRFVSYKVTSDSVAATQLDSLNAISPHFAISVEKYVGGPLSVVAGAEAMPFVYYSGGSSSILFSYGGGILGGLRFDISPRWTLDTAVRISTFRRPVDGDSAVQEKHANATANIKLRF
ncbi:MAG: hypothetical protein AAB250_15870 [Bdellovibrionota bacterium]|mgnify:CR=1 FL=1